MMGFQSQSNPVARFTRLALVSALLAKPALAQDLPRDTAVTPWCQEGEVHAPNGAPIQVGERWYRLCARANSPADDRVIRVTLNPALFPDINEDFLFWALRIVSRGSYTQGLETRLRYLNPTGIRMLGNMPFQVYDKGNYGPNGLPGLSAYVPLNLNVATGSGIPAYYVYCTSESDKGGGGGLCSVRISYFDIEAALGLHFRLSETSPHQGLGDFDVPALPAKIRRILSRADITDELDDWIGRLPVDDG